MQVLLDFFFKRRYISTLACDGLTSTASYVDGFSMDESERKIFTIVIGQSGNGFGIWTLIVDCLGHSFVTFDLESNFSFSFRKKRVEVHVHLNRLMLNKIKVLATDDFLHAFLHLIVLEQSVATEALSETNVAHG